MLKPREEYIKEISSMYDNIPDKVEFYNQEFTVQKTWKIGNKRDCDMTRDQFIQELEQVNMFDVNQYKVSWLKT